MTTTLSIWLVIVLVGIGSFLSRAVFFFLASRIKEVPESAIVWLRMVPPAAFAALVMPALFIPDGTFRPITAEVLAAVLASLTAWKTKSIAGTILVGLGAVVLLRQVPMLA